MKQTLKLAKILIEQYKKPKGSGAFGDFFSIGNRIHGVKVLRSVKNRHEKIMKDNPHLKSGFVMSERDYYQYLDTVSQGASSLADLKSSSLWRMAQREFANQERAYNKVPDLIPQPIRLVPVQISGRWYPGIVMEMVKGKRLSDYLQDRSQRNLYIRKVRYAMRKYGIELDDLHDENILITRGGYPKLIDFMHVSIKKRTTSCRSQLRLQA